MNKRRLLGQHMLIDNDILRTIADFAELSRNDVVFEIGTGNGKLTAELCERARSVISCEVDKEMHKEAQNTLGKYSNLLLVVGDGFKADYDFDVFVSNLPYSKSRMAVEWLAERDFEKAFVMVQKEFASKLLARNGSNYRAVSALAQYCFDIEPLMEVGKNSFYPKPKVDSVLLKMTKRRKVGKEVIRELKLLFSFRGKKVRSAARKLGINESLDDKRVEGLSPEEAIRLAEKIAQERLLQTI
ncbi:MAG: 16S rRNA (adenine(1518)-N(6)/adenine(1519)-N(6))-dimethyltransferase RsmA [Nitrososphaerales archaeon]